MLMKCYYCKKWLKHDNNFGYCKKYNCQAKGDENCKIIQKIAPGK